MSRKPHLEPACPQAGERRSPQREGSPAWGQAGSRIAARFPQGLFDPVEAIRKLTGFLPQRLNAIANVAYLRGRLGRS